MSLLSHLIPSALINKVPSLPLQVVRQASKKAGGSTKYGSNRRGRAHHYGWKAQDGRVVTAGSILVKQRTLRYHPGENVQIGRSGDLLALENGTVAVTCEPFTPDTETGHVWVKRAYSDRPAGTTIYKKYYHVLVQPQVGRFKLVAEV